MRWNSIFTPKQIKVIQLLADGQPRNCNQITTSLKDKEGKPLHSDNQTSVKRDALEPLRKTGYLQKNNSDKTYQLDLSLLLASRYNDLYKDSLNTTNIDKILTDRVRSKLKKLAKDTTFIKQVLELNDHNSDIPLRNELNSVKELLATIKFIQDAFRGKKEVDPDLRGVIYYYNRKSKT